MNLSKNITNIYEEYSDAMFAYARHMGFDEASTMDAIHDVFYKLCTKTDSYKNIVNVKAFLFRSLKNRLIDMTRSKNETLESLSENIIIKDELSFQFNATIEDELIRKEDEAEILEIINKVLAKLTDRQREIIYLRHLQECNYEEIADIMNLSIKACRNLLSKALKKLGETALVFIKFISIIGI